MISDKLPTAISVSVLQLSPHYPISGGRNICIIADTWFVQMPSQVRIRALSFSREFYESRQLRVLLIWVNIPEWRHRPSNQFSFQCPNVQATGECLKKRKVSNMAENLKAFSSKEREREMTKLWKFIFLFVAAAHTLLLMFLASQEKCCIANFRKHYFPKS